MLLGIKLPLIQLLMHLILILCSNIPTFRRNYVDGIRLNFNNGQFGFVAGLHNGYFTDSDHLNDGNVGLDIAASVMIIPGLEFRLGFGYENNDCMNNSISGYNLGLQLNDGFIQACLQINVAHLSRG